MSRLVICALIAACSSAATAPSPQALSAPTATQPKQRVLRLVGSNTLGSALVPDLVQTFLASRGAKFITVNDKGKAKERVWIQAELGGEQLAVEVLAPGSAVGFQSLAKGYCDLVMASRPIHDDEVQLLAPLGDMTSPASESIIALDGIAVIVHPNNPIDHLSAKDLAKIYSGAVTSWKQLGGPALPIERFARDAKSGTHDAFESLVMGGAKLASDRAFEDSDALAKAVEAAPGAIGFVGLPFVRGAKVLAIQDGSRALLPTPFTIATEDYPLSRRLLFYAPAEPKDPLIHDFIAFATSDEAQDTIRDAGFVSLALRAELSAVPANAPPPYAKLATGGTRMSVNFRFRASSATVDGKALRDLDRLARYLAAAPNHGRRVALVGFSDAQGTEVQNKTLATERVAAVARLLSARGIEPTETLALGSALPVAPNDTATGRARNRRVEVWLR